MVKIYHYTNYDGKIAVEKSGFLKMSKGKVGDAVYGDGMYLTLMGPHEPTEFLIMNNRAQNGILNLIRHFCPQHRSAFTPTNFLSLESFSSEISGITLEDTCLSETVKLSGEMRKVVDIM